MRSAHELSPHTFTILLELETDPISVDSITTVQPTIIDSTGRLRPDYLASSSGSKASKLQLFQNTLAGFDAYVPYVSSGCPPDLLLLTTQYGFAVQPA